MSVPAGLAAISLPPGQVVIAAGCAVAALVLITWLVSLALGDASVIDPVWGPAFALVAVVCALAGGGDTARRWLLCGLTVVWGMRLGLHLTARKLAEPGEDRRYRAMRTAHPRHFALWSLVYVYLLQGVLVILISLPIQAAGGRDGALTAACLPGIALFLLGLAFEGIGDLQLQRFRADPANRGAVMNRGLWRYTRHPNYFGDACVWWGIWLLALQAGGTWWTAVAPLVMTLLLVRVSGKALLEQDIAERRPGYADYVRSTSGFFPLPPKRPL